MRKSIVSPETSKFFQPKPLAQKINTTRAPGLSDASASAMAASAQ
jgi:hypothetical protein